MSREKGYYKGELRACPFCGSEAIFTKDHYVMCSNMESCDLNSGLCKVFETAKHWNTRPAFDKAIDVLTGIGLGYEMLNELFETKDDDWQLLGDIKETVCSITRLTWAEALAIYHDRQESPDA
jgi:hypothetical protein